MNELQQFPVISEYLTQLARRVRWRRWLTRLSRSLWIIAVTFLLLYAADLVYDLDTMTLRNANVVVLVGALSLFLLDFFRAWFSRLDLIGVAQLLERHHPDLSERLVTIVQIQNEKSQKVDPEFAYLLGVEAQKQLASVSISSACPLHCQRRFLGATAVVLASLFGGLHNEPSFDDFSDRFFLAWATSTEQRWPFQIRLTCTESYGGGVERIECDGQVIELSRLDRHVYAFSVDTIMIDRRAKKPSECRLVCEDGAGGHTKILMQPLGPLAVGQFFCEIDNPSVLRKYWAECGGVFSWSVLMVPFDRPAFAAPPAVAVAPPRYTGQTVAAPISLDAPVGGNLDLLRFSRMDFRFSVTREPIAGWLRVKRKAETEHEVAEESVAAVAFCGAEHRGQVEVIAAKPGTFESELILRIDGGLCVVLPVGQWTVHDDHEPRFTQPLRLAGGAEPLSANKEYKISPDDALKLQTAVEDAEGLESIAIEYRVNDGPPRVETWINAAAKNQLAINDWLPLPTGLKDGDRVQFRVLVSDNRRLKKGEVKLTKDGALPSDDLSPHVVTAPAGGNQWIRLHVDRSSGDFLNQQVQAQSDAISDIVGKIKQKLISASQQVEKLQRTVHQQFALSLEQKQQADRIRALNREITEDLFRSGERFAANSDLAALADHFFDIAETEMLRSAEALNRFGAKDRPFAEAEKDLQASQDALVQAQKKLDRMIDWNKLVAQDRLDQWQLEKLANRQEALATRLGKLLADQPLDDAEMRKQIEAIRAEQARLAEQRDQLEAQSQVGKDSLEAMQQKNIQRLAEAAEKLAAEQRKMPGLEPDKLAKLTAELRELAQKGMGLEARAMAKDAEQAVDQAKKAMDASQTLKGKGEGEAAEAKTMDDTAAKQLDLVAKRLAQFTEEQAKKGAAKAAAALKESGAQMKIAQDSLPAKPKDAQNAMKGAAQKLGQAAEQARRQAARHLPQPARNPAAKASISRSGVTFGAVPKDTSLGSFQGKTWGELPGELKTSMMQEFRSRFGEEYAELIQQYFERLADLPAPSRKK